LNDIKALREYRTCTEVFSHWAFLIDEAIKDLVVALRSYKSSTYRVQNNKIVYVDGMSIVDNVIRGYDTIWAYYHEHNEGEISSDSLEYNAGIIINCGAFSYAEMPHDFFYITGVTGTLKTLADTEKKILTDVYTVKKNTYMPSAFGNCKRLYNSNTDVRVVSEAEYYTLILEEISTMRNARRAILVFFESEEKLKKFYSSSDSLSKDPNIQIITETVAVKDRQILIRRAATIEKVTLLTKTFGRGTDFICNNQQLLANGGVHVLQTFFSEELSEEYQIMGRGARQGDQGSYRMILLDKDLEWLLGSSWMTELNNIRGELYKHLNAARNAIFQTKCNSKGVGIAQRRKEHEASKEFMKALNNDNIEKVKEFLKQQNRGVNILDTLSRTMLLMDATGSMSSLLSAVKETVCTMFERAADVLNENGMSNVAFQMQFVVYRDYDCMEEGILQSSSWETKPTNLRNFLEPIIATGGGDYEEAIEIGLWYAAQNMNGLSQVILIGDAPAKERPAIQRDRKAYGGESYWSKTKFSTQTYYLDELRTLRDQNILVHTFYLANGARNNFQNIATPRVGRCQSLDIKSAKGVETLTNCITEEILRNAAGKDGDAAVELYRRRYVVGYLR